MKVKVAAFAAAWLVAFAAGASAEDCPTPTAAKELIFASKGDLSSLDPYAATETFSLGLLGNVYEGLTKRSPDGKVIPGLAESWDPVESTRWRVSLRKQVKFQGEQDFTADDVVFSVKRMRAKGSRVATRLPPDAKVIKVDDYTVDFVLSSPDPILPYEWDTWYIMSKPWIENGPADVIGDPRGLAATSANGTGPFSVAEHEPGVRTLFKPNAKWWGTPEHNFDRVVFCTILDDADRVDALLSDKVDLIDPVPPADLQRVNASTSSQVLAAPELRILFLGFDVSRDQLKYSDAGGNPFKDPRVRQAFYQAIDIQTLESRVMRNLATATASIVAPTLSQPASQLSRRNFDLGGARKLMADAGYPDGFQLGMDCPNDRYVNDETICQAVAGMLSRIGVDVQVHTLPKAKYFTKILAAGGYDTSFYLLGWTPESFDIWNVLENLVACRDETTGSGRYNIGGYCDTGTDQLINQTLVETDATQRDALVSQVLKIVDTKVLYIPLHQQMLLWGVSKKLTVKQRADNRMLFYEFSKP